LAAAPIKLGGARRPSFDNNLGAGLFWRPFRAKTPRLARDCPLEVVALQTVASTGKALIASDWAAELDLTLRADIERFVWGGAFAVKDQTGKDLVSQNMVGSEGILFGCGGGGV